MIKKTPKTEAEWKKKLTSEQFEILRKGATEPAFGGKWLRNKEKGVYSCAGCGLELFDVLINMTQAVVGLVFGISAKMGILNYWKMIVRACDG